MPRDASGLYSLPSGNPVITNTVISSVWANTTLSDIAAQLNNVYTRDGLLGPTAPFKVVDGTVAAPGLAFNAEPGNGWFRPGTNQVSWASSGQVVEEINAAAATTKSLWNRAANGLVQFVMRNSNAATAARNGVSFGVAADGTGYLNALNDGGASAKSMTFYNHANYLFGSPLQAPELYVDMATDFGIRQDDTAKYHTFAPSWFLGYTKATGLLTWNGVGRAATQFLPNGDFISGRDLFIGADAAAMGLVISNANERYLRVSGDGWRLSWVTANGDWRFLSAGGNIHFQVNGNGTGVQLLAGGQFQIPGGNQGDGWSRYTSSGMILRTQFINGSVRFYVPIDCIVEGMQQTLSFEHNPGVFAQAVFRIGGGSFGFKSDNDAFKGGGSATWSLPSDRRVKQDIVDFTLGLPAILSLRAREFAFQSDPNDRVVGVVADEAEQSLLRRIIKRKPGKLPDGTDVADLAQANIDPVIWALVNAVKTLHERISELEAAP